MVADPGPRAVRQSSHCRATSAPSGIQPGLDLIAIGLMIAADHSSMKSARRSSGAAGGDDRLAAGSGHAGISFMNDHSAPSRSRALYSR